MTSRLTASAVALFLVLVFGLGYIWVVLIQNDPTHPPYRLSVQLPASGGLLERSNVSLRGSVIGRVDTIDLNDEGVIVTVQVKHSVDLPADTDVVVGALSVAGEQYLDFRPRTADGPFLHDGDLVKANRVTVPVPFGELLADLVRFAEQIDPAKLKTIASSLEQGLRGGEQDLQTLFGNSETLMGVLEKAEPDTMALLDRGSEVLDLAADTKDDWRTIASSSRKLARQLREADPSVRTLLGEGPDTLKLMDRFARELKDPLEEGLDEGSTVTTILGARVPAIGELLDALRRGALAASRVVNSGSIEVGADLDPNAPTCDYLTPRRSPTIGGSPAPYLYAYCPQGGPRLLQRGAPAAPRPPGDGTAGPPAGANRTARAGDD